MSKLAIDMVEEFHALDVVEDDFELYALTLKLNDSGEVTSTESIKPIERVESDAENKECLLHISQNSKALKISKAKIWEDLGTRYLIVGLDK